jgi:hypothetical protein
MTVFRVAGSWAVGMMLMAPGWASAAWDNVFQLTCCNSTPRVSQRPCCPTPAPACCPQTAFIQRSFYQPVTAFRPVTTLEPVTTMRTSFYWEPVNTCTYSLFVDPCTGCAQQVAKPTTSFQLRSRCDAVTNYVQRISYQPVTAYRQSFYMEPVTVNPCCPTTTASAAPVLSVPAPVVTAPPVEHTPPPPTATPPLNLTPDNRAMPQISEKTLTPNTAMPRPPQPILLRPDQVASGSVVTGTVVRNDYRPQANARIRFVTANGQQLQPVNADSSGRFQVQLAKGTYKIYTEDATGRPVYHSDFVVTAGERNVTVVSR